MDCFYIIEYFFEIFEKKSLKPPPIFEF